MCLKQFNVRVLFLGMCTLLCSTPLTAQSSDIAGRVVSSAGEVVAVYESTRTSRAIVRRSEIYPLEIIATNERGTVQVRMIDSALISLGCNSSLKIEDYSYMDDVANDIARIRLLSGRLRTITGSIGERNQQRYQFYVGDVSIKIRGTDFEVVYEESSETIFVAAYDGGITVDSPSGSIDLGIGADNDFARITAGSEPVGFLVQPPGMRTGSSIQGSSQQSSPC